MDATPKPPKKKLTRWAFDVANSPFGKNTLSAGADPLESLADEDDYDAHDALSFLSTQLVAHGFLSRPMDLSSLGEEQKRLLEKCLSGLLAERADDHATLSSIQTKHKTLIYDFERSQELLRREREARLNSEKDREGEKARALAISKSLAEETEKHRVCREDMLKARTALSFVKNQCLQDQRRREIEVSSVLNKWQRITDLSSSLGPNQHQHQSSMNISIVSSAPAERRPNKNALLEEALKDADNDREKLMEEVGQWQAVAAGIVKELISMGSVLGVQVGNAETDEGKEGQAAVIAYTIASSPASTSSRAAEIVSAMHDAVDKLAAIQARCAEEQTRMLSDLGKTHATETETLKDEIESLTKDAEDARARLAQAESELKSFIEAGLTSGPPAQEESRMDTSADGPATVNGETERAWIERHRRRLEEERQKFTEAAVRLGKERAEMEAERLAFFEEKRAFQVQLMLNDMPPTPQAHDATIAATSAYGLPSTLTSPSRDRLSPSRISVQPTHPSDSHEQSLHAAQPPTSTALVAGILALAADSPPPMARPELSLPTPRRKRKSTSNTNVPNKVLRPSAQENEIVPTVAERARDLPRSLKDATKPKAPAPALRQPSNVAKSTKAPAPATKPRAASSSAQLVRKR